MNGTIGLQTDLIIKNEKSDRMIKKVVGDIFDCDADVILHQVNCQGVMGSGVAKQVKEKFPEVFNAYITLCNSYRRNDNRCVLLGYSQCVQIHNCDRYIVNLFAQENYGYDGNCYTDYEALKECLRSVNSQFVGKKIAIPYLMACHRGGGDWSVVSKMIEETLTDCDVTLYEYCGG